MRRAKPDRAAMTMIELLIVCAIITVILGLMLPAMVGSREAARRAQCGNNLRQIALALMNYETQRDVLPPGVINPTGPIHNRPNDDHIGWIIQLLPYMEQSGLFSSIDTTTSVYDPINQGGLSTRFNTMSCPSDRNSGVFKGIGVTSYAACHHDVEAPIDSDNHGVFFLNRCLRGPEITDGRSFTLFVGEKVITRPDLGWMSGTRASLRNTGTALNAPAIQPTSDLYVGGFASKHDGGANFMFGDGSVRYVRETINPGVFRLLGHRADGELIGGNTF